MTLSVLRIALTGLFIVFWAPTNTLRGQDEQAAPEIRLGQGRVVLQAPAAWISKKPTSRIVEFEFAAPNKDEETARVTMMAAGGGAEANIARWVGQFEHPDGNKAPDSTVEKTSHAGYELFLVNILGTYKDRPGGPLAGGKEVKRPMYRMLGAILVTENAGQYYVKMYGPAASVEANAEAFKKMVSDAKVTAK